VFAKVFVISVYFRWNIFAKTKINFRENAKTKIFVQLYSMRVRCFDVFVTLNKNNLRKNNGNNNEMSIGCSAARSRVILKDPQGNPAPALAPALAPASTLNFNTLNFQRIT
jgi:hypothetical protein